MSKMDFAPHCFKIVILSLCISFLGCAEIGPPPGGSIDKTKPRLLESFPENGSTLVPQDNKITITFSERIKKPTSNKTIYISPRPTQEPELTWKSDRLIITLADSFAVNQTYIISFGDEIQDLRNNTLDSGSIIAFTTGEKLAEGNISGQVVDENNLPVKNILTALYNKNEIESATVIDSLYPTYIATTDDKGYFSFRYIPNGDYLVIAFNDKNKNERLNPERELYGIPLNSTTLDSSLASIKEMKIPLTFHNSNQIEIKAVQQTEDNTFLINFSNLQDDLPSNAFTLQKYADTSLPIVSKFILKKNEASQNVVQTYFGILPEGNYKLALQQSTDYEPIIFDSVRVKVLEDKTNPAITLFQPERSSILPDSTDIQIQFSEPLDTTAVNKETFYILDTDSNLIFPSYEFVNQSLCKISHDFITKDVFKYQLHISEFDIKDLAGNQMGDSTTSYDIEIINPDSLGTVNGYIQRDNQTHVDTYLQVRNLTSQQLFTFYTSDSTFSFEVPQGQYIISGYSDLNKNKKRDFGSIYPFTYAEPFFKSDDTLKVRARFETTNVKLEFK